MSTKHYNIVIARLTGGLGNQMFQYAAARCVAARCSLPLKLDISWFEMSGNWTPRKYELGVFGLSSEFASDDEVNGLKTKRQNALVRRLPVFLKNLLWHKNQTHIIEKSYAFDPDILGLSGQIYLDGYWQSYRYFQDFADIVRKDFSFNNVDGLNAQTAQMINSCDAVSLHIRRGDYVTLASASACHGLCSLQYYEEAANLIKSHVPSPVFFVFSDDVQWVRSNLDLGATTYFIDHNGHAPHMDMYLMSCCKHHIIANSSFSWWGAWLGHNPGKIIIAPKRWFNDTAIDTSDLMPMEWIRI